MSIQNEVFAALPMLLRSTTPVVSEKVLIWHQRMQEEEPLPPERDHDQSEPDTTPPDPQTWQSESFQQPQPIFTHAPTARSESSPNSAKFLEELAASKSGVDYAGVVEVEEVESNIQERSQVHSRRSSIHIKSLHIDEQVTPSQRPKYLSQDTVPSFGNLDASAFEPNRENTPAPSAHLAPMGSLTPKIDIQAPSSSDPEHSMRGSKHSRAPSRMSNVRIGSVHDTDDNETVRDEGDARTVPVETVRPAASHKSRSVASHHPSERGRPLSQAPAKTKSRASALSPPPQSVKSHAKSGISMHPSQMPLPSSMYEGSVYDATPTQTQRTIPLQTHIHSQRASNHAPSQHAPSQHAPSQYAPSQHEHSQRAPSRASTSGNIRAATAKEPSQIAPSAHGSTAHKHEKKETSLHPLSNHPGGSVLYQGSHYGGSKYAGSLQGGGQPPSLHPLTQHLQAHPPGSHRTHSHLSQTPYIPPHTAEEMIHANIRGRAVAVSPTPSNPHGLPQPPFTQTYMHQSHHYSQEYRETPSRLRDDNRDELDEEQQQIIDNLLIRTPRTSHTVTPSALAAEVHNSSFHDEDLCVLLHAADDDTLHDVVKKAVRKAIRGRVRRLGIKHENQAILQRFRSPDGSQHQPHYHAPQQVAQPPSSPQERVLVMQPDQEPPYWVKDMMVMMQDTRSRLEELERKKKSGRSYAPTESQLDNEGTVQGTRRRDDRESVNNDLEGVSPITITLAVNTPGRTGTIIEESILQPGQTEFTRAESERGHTIVGVSEHHKPEASERVDDEIIEEEYPEVYETGTRLRESANNTPPTQDGEVKSRQELNRLNSESERDDSTGKQVLEEEIYKLRIKATRSAHSRPAWQIEHDEPDNPQFTGGSELIPEIPDIEGTSSGLLERKTSPALVDHRGSGVPPYTQGDDYVLGEPPAPPPWQRIHQRLLSWAIAWPMSELDQALNSTTRGHQVDEVALTIWTTQTYKRYVRARLTEHPPSRVDRLFIPPNVAEAINNAVYNGRHGDACGILRDMWAPLGLDGMPRLLLVLAKHKREENHWVAHRFSLPDGSLATYDTYPERGLPDGRPLGWWFAIRIAWPHALYPSPEQVKQRVVRMHRPLQLGIDNSLAMAGVWRNLLMGSKAERSIDLERLRDLVNTEVKNLRQRKDMGKLSLAPQRPNWEDMP